VASKKRRRFPADVKAKVALEAVRGLKTVPEIASYYKVHPTQISKWKKELIARLPELFAIQGEGSDKDQDELVSSLYEEIGRLKVELDWLKKKLDGSY
jgi:transposase-like protein